MTALLVSECDPVHCMLDEVFRKAGWELRRAHSYAEALNALAQDHVEVVILSADTPAFDWRQLLAMILRASNPPKVVVTARLADDYLWAEVLNCGGYDVLVQPFNSEEIRRVMLSASRHSSAPKRDSANPTA